MTAADPFRMRRIAPADVGSSRSPTVPRDVLLAAADIVDRVAGGGEAELRAHGERYDGLEPGDPIILPRPALEDALAALDADARAVLRRTADRIEVFARAQRDTATSVDVAVEGGRAGDRLLPVNVAGCYAPGGRYPLPSSVLMTAVTARAAGVREVWVASPRPTRAVLAAAAVAGAEGVIALGGAHAVAAMAHGVAPVPRCDVVVGPGNHWVTAAKLLLSGVVGIDLLAGPSELVVLASDDADPELVAADLLAQAEHDPDALPVLVSTSAGLLDRVDGALGDQLADLPTAATARESLGTGFAVLAADEDEAVACCEALAPEHLQLHGTRAAELADSLGTYGSLFVGAATAEVFGDYGVGPNHTLPTGGTARFTGGLSVFAFLRRPTWIRLSEPVPESLVRDAAALARMEGLEAHARAAEARRRNAPGSRDRSGGGPSARSAGESAAESAG